jgi:hypothetical protein
MIGPGITPTFDGTTTVYANWGLWVAECPVCPSAEHYGPHPQTDYLGGLTLKTFVCSNCGSQATPKWPRNRKQIETVLSARRSPANRNWTPGETVELLQAENEVM